MSAILQHMVWLSVNLRCRSETCCTGLAENTEYRTQKVAKKSPSGHHRATLSGYIFTTKARIDNWKKNLLSRNISSTCPHNIHTYIHDKSYSVQSYIKQSVCALQKSTRANKLNKSNVKKMSLKSTAEGRMRVNESYVDREAVPDVWSAD